MVMGVALDENVNKMLRSIDKLEKCFGHCELPTFIEEFRKDLNVLFEMVKDDKDFRSSLVVLLIDIVDQINIYEFKEYELTIIKDMTMSLLDPVTGEKLDHYIGLAVNKNMLTIRIPEISPDLYE